MKPRTLLLAAALPLGAAASAADLAKLTATPPDAAIALTRTPASFTLSFPAGTRYALETELDWRTRRDGSLIVLDVTLPPGTRARLESQEENGSAVVRLVSLAAPAPNANAGNPTASAGANNPTGSVPGRETPKPPDDNDAMRKMLALALGNPAADAKFDPAARADFAVPSVPAAAAIGSKAETIRPYTPRQFSTEILSKTGDGKLASGFALAATPYLMFADVPLKTYRESGWTRFFSSLQLSLANVVGGDPRGASAARVSAALSGVVFDLGDARLDEQLDRDFTGILPAGGLPQFDLEKPLPAMETDKTKAWGKAVDASRQRNWNRPSLGFGYAPRWFSATAKTNDLKPDGGVAWTALALPGFGSIAEHTQFLGSAQYRYRERLPLPGKPASIGAANVWAAGAQMRFGSPEFNGFAEAFWNRRAFPGGVTERVFSYELGAEKKLTPGLWLQLSVSETRPAPAGTQTEVKSGLRYAFGDGPKLDPATLK